jgi:hypothetical protein
MPTQTEKLRIRGLPLFCAAHEDMSCDAANVRAHRGSYFGD